LEGEPCLPECKCLLGPILYAASIVQKRTPTPTFNEFGVSFQERVIISNPRELFPARIELASRVFAYRVTPLLWHKYMCEHYRHIRIF
jgi:hypothetical protein